MLYGIPDWMRSAGVDIRGVGLLTLAQLPWALKALWSPLMDRFDAPFWGRRRGWIAVTQILLVACGLWLAGLGNRPESVWVVGALALAIAIASASHDIAFDAYTVEVLHPAEQGAVAGVRTAMYRAAMALSGGAAIAAAARFGWPAVNVLLALVYVPLFVVSWRAPEPDVVYRRPLRLTEAVWRPLADLLSRPSALEVLAFVVCYKIGDQLAQSLTLPFLVDMGYAAEQRGLAMSTIGLLATICGAILGGWTSTLIGLGHSLWLFGALQLVSNAGYLLLALTSQPSVPLMYGAVSVEMFTSGLGTGAFSVLLLRMTEKRFSATQYAVLSSLFALPRSFAGPVAGFVVHAFGWPAFYLMTMVVGLPGLLALARFVPPGVREPRFAGDDSVDDRAGVM